jgi:hypothetical protein
MAIEGLVCGAIGCVKTRQGEDAENPRGAQFSGAARGSKPKLVASGMWPPMTYFEKVRTKPPHVIKMPPTTPGKEAGSWNFTLAMTCAMRKNKTT